MGGKSDQAKGRIKEAVGDLTGDDDLKSEGRIDRLAGVVEEKVSHAADKVESVIDKAKDAAHEVADKRKAAHRRS